MDESFEHRPLLTRETLRALQQRRDAPSIIRLTLQLSPFFLCVGFVVGGSALPLVAAPATVVLGAIWATLFAPFHECIHQTAFQSKQLNEIGAWLSGIPFGMAPTVYRAFHFEHHRHTQDPQKDPELMTASSQPARRPRSLKGWLMMAPGMGLTILKGSILVRFSFLPYAQWEERAPWVPPIEQRPRLAWESRITGLCWLALLVAAFVGPSGLGLILIAALIGHVFQALWITTEHTGLPYEGSILARTRTMFTSPLISWWLWNMNYHAEHHTWPAIPWHQLPAVHSEIAEHLEAEERGYARLQLNVVRNNLLA